MSIHKIGVVGGLGHIGLIQAACMAKLGYATVAYDINRKKIAAIRQGIMPFQEEGLTQLVQEGMASGGLSFTENMVDLQDAEAVFFCVGTPSLPNGEADISQLTAAVQQVASIKVGHCLAIIKSTVPVGTALALTQLLQREGLGGRMTIVSNPEFLREGTGIQDFWEPARVIVGAEEQEAARQVAQLYLPAGTPVVCTSWENAELIKYASNAFLATKISFINEIALLCEQVGANVQTVSQGIGLDPRINPYFIEAGVGFSGPCLEKDLKSLIAQFAQNQAKAKILEAVQQVNLGQRRGIVEKAQQQLGGLAGKRVGVLGMAFKPQTDDVRESHSLPIVRELLRWGAIVTVTDPWVKSIGDAGLVEQELPGVEWLACPYETARDKDALIILTAWQEYRELDLVKLTAAMANPLIIDGRNLYQPEELKALKIHYLGVGI